VLDAMQMHMPNYKELKAKYNELQHKSKALCKKVSYYRTRYETDVVDIFKEDTSITHNDAQMMIITQMMKVEDIFMKVNLKPMASWKKFRRDIARCIWSDEHKFCQMLHDEMNELMLQVICETIYSPANILKAMDLAGGTLSMEGIEVLRAIEHQGRKWFKCLLPSPAAIKK